MANQVANAAKGRFNELLLRVLNNDPVNSGMVIMALQVNEGDAALLDYADFGALLAGASTECTFTNYARVVFTDVDVIASVVNNALDTRNADVPDWTYTAAGGTLDNNVLKLVFGYDPDTTGGTDANIEVVSHHDFVQSTNGGDIDAAVAALGFASAGQ